jgi:membrane associated rhomboid family serine protease
MSYQQYRSQGFRALPLVVKNLLIINVLLFAATEYYQSVGFDLTDYLGLHNFSSDLFRPYQLVTYMFMHGGLDHIFFNMFALWMFGNVLENFWGPKRFLTFYMVTGIGSALIYLCYESFHLGQLQATIDVFLANPNPESYITIVKDNFGGLYNIPENQLQIDEFVRNWSVNLQDPVMIKQASIFMDQLYNIQINSPMIGASGAVFGVLMAFGMLFPNTELFLMFIPIPVKAKYAVILYGVIELVAGVAQISGDNVAHFAHLGGMLFGFVLIKFWQKRSNHFY